MNKLTNKIESFFSKNDFSEREGICFLLDLFIENPELNAKYVADEILLKIEVVDETHEDKLYSIMDCLYGYCSKSCSLYQIETHLHPTISEHGEAIMSYFGFKQRKV